MSTLKLKVMKRRLELLLEEKDFVNNKPTIYEDEIKLIHSKGDDFDAGSFRGNQMPINFQKSSIEPLE